MNEHDAARDEVMARVRAARAGHDPACDCRLCVLGTAAGALLRMLRDLDRHVDRDADENRGVDAA